MQKHPLTDLPSASPSAEASGESRSDAARTSLVPSLTFRPRTVPDTALVSDRHLPLLISTFRGSLELTSVQRHDDEVHQILRREFAHKRPVVYVVDARGLLVPSPLVRRHWANRVNEFRSDLEALLGTFIVLDNSLVRGALTAITWMTNAGDALGYAPSLEEAVQRANERLGERGHPLVRLNPSAYPVAPPRL